MLTTCVMLGSIAVVEDTDILKLGEFSYRQFETMAVRKLDKWVNDTHVQFKWVSGKAIVSAKEVKIADHKPIVVEDENGWARVEAMVRLWMLENKQSLDVKLTTEYRKKVPATIELSDHDSIDKKKVTTVDFWLKCRPKLGWRSSSKSIGIKRNSMANASML